MTERLARHLRAIAFLMVLNRTSEVAAATIIPVEGAQFDYKEGVLIVDKTALERLRDILIGDEGIELKPYTDTCGVLSIGVGRNLRDVGLTEREALMLLDNDIQRVLVQAKQAFPWFDKLNAPRQVVVLSMIFNLGMKGFQEFTKTIAALQVGDYNQASQQMLKSAWATQVPHRAQELSGLMKSGVF